MQLLAQSCTASSDFAQRRPGLLPLRAFDVQVYRVCEVLTEALVYAMVVFGPWAFGTTQRWSIWTMNIAGYALALLLALKLSIRWLKGYQPPRCHASLGACRDAGRHANSVWLLTFALAMVTLLLLCFCLLSAINSSATFCDQAQSF